MIGLLLLAVLPVDSSAFWTGNDILARCEGEANDQRDCMGYVTGASDMLGAAQTVGEARPVMCQPDNVSRKQVVDIVVRYLRNHPSNRHYLGGSLVRIALMDAFPCKP